MEDKFLFQLSKVEHALKQHMTERMREAGVSVTAGQAGILFLLKNSEGMNMSELGRVLEIDNSAITRLVDRLENQGLVRRSPREGDRRQYLIEITEKGRQDIEKIGAIAHEVNEKIKEGFSDAEIAIFKKILFSFHEKFNLKDRANGGVK